MSWNVLNDYYAQQIAHDMNFLPSETAKYNAWNLDHKEKVFQFNDRRTPAKVYIKFDGGDLGLPEFE